MDTETGTVTRRDLLKKGALVGGAVLWATPVVQVVGMGRAYAKEVSPNCSRYCLKWNVDDNEKTGERTCTLDGTIHAYDVWSNNWEELGGGNKQAVSDAAPQPQQPEAEPVPEVGAAAAAAAAPDGVDNAAPASPGEISDSPRTDTGDAAVADTGTQNDGDSDDHSGTVPTVPAAGAAAAATTVPDGTPDAETEAPIAEPEPQTADSEEDSLSDGGGGTILECPDDGVNDESAAQQIGSKFVVYGPAIDGADSGGFWIAFPSDIKLADLHDESEPWSAAVKCGQDESTFRMSDLPLEDDPCLADYRRIFIPACDTGRHDISHIELIVDWCP